MHPIVLAHGFIGYRNFLLWSMFGGVADALRERGFQVVHAQVHPTASIEERSHQWVERIERELGADERFHWIGHSMGGLDGRYIASPGGLNLGRRFITLTTLSTPHRGSPLANRIPQWLRNLVSGASKIGRFFLSGEQRQFVARLAENRWDGLDQLTPEYIQNSFNPKIEDSSEVRYISYAGFVDYSKTTWKNILRQPAWRYMCANGGDNDGMVSVESAKWGEFKDILPCDHGEMVGLRVIPWVKLKFDYISFFIQLAEELKQLDSDE